MPRPYVDARSSFFPPLLNSRKAVTGTLGRNPELPAAAAGPTSAQFAAEVGLANTPTSLPAYTVPVCPSTTSASAGASGKLVENAVHVSPAFVVLKTWPTWNPMTAAYAVCPVASDGSIAMADTGKCPGLIVLVRSAISVVPAFVVTNTRPPDGFVAPPSPSVPA